MGGRRRSWGLLLWSAWLIAAEPGICASFSGVAVDDSGKPVSGATVRWNNQSVCAPSPPHGTPVCAPSTVNASTITASDGSFAANNLPADTYYVCLYPVAANQLASCDWLGSGETGPSRITLTADQDLTGLKLILRTGSLVVIKVKDPMNATAASFFLPGVVVGTGGYYRAEYDTGRQAYTHLVPKGIAARLFFDTLLLVQDAEGNGVPIDTPVLPFTASGDETAISIGVTPALVNAASYLPGIAEGSIATLFGSGFTDVPGIHPAGDLPLPTQILGTTVRVNGAAAPLLAVAGQDGQDQINFQLPHSVQYNPLLTIVVENNGKTQTFYSKTWESQLGVFGYLTHPNGDAITPTSPARPGEQITIYWTGMNGFNFVYSAGVFFVPDGISSPPSTPCVSYFDPQVQIGGVKADLNSCSAAPGLVGVGQLVVVVPPGLPSGGYDVAVTMQGITGNVVQLPVTLGK